MENRRICKVVKVGDDVYFLEDREIIKVRKKFKSKKLGLVKLGW